MTDKDKDTTELARRSLQTVINSLEAEREVLEKIAGPVWDTRELTRDFEVLGFLAPFVVVRRRSDGQKGSLSFQHDPRYYFSFQPE
jgi:hypothetical protein